MNETIGGKWGGEGRGGKGNKKKFAYIWYPLPPNKLQS